jgi:hypothetical protein
MRATCCSSRSPVRRRRTRRRNVVKSKAQVDSEMKRLSQILRVESIARPSRADGRASNARDSRVVREGSTKAAATVVSRGAVVGAAGSATGAAACSCGKQRAGLPPGQHIMAASIAAAVLVEQHEQRCEPADALRPQVARSRRQTAIARRMVEMYRDKPQSQTGDAGRARVRRTVGLQTESNQG